MPNYNVVYLDKADDVCVVLNGSENTKVPSQSFGANISNLLADSFFINDGLVGEFAVYKIDKTIEWLQKGKTGTSDEEYYHQKIIELIDEPLIQKKLSELYTAKTGRNLVEEKILETQIGVLQEKLNALKNKL